jgi:prepilin signal peptidase PulO-like enzyme (type II secretory pathway)
MAFQLFWDLVVGIFGLCIGSFLNVVIYRLETNKDLSGRSFCPHCKHQLAWHDLIPVLSFFLLSGKCRYCHKSIARQYPLVEISTGILFLLIFAIQFNGLSVLGIAKLLFLFYIASALVVIFFYDAKHFLIPDKILLPAIIIAAVYDLVFSCWNSGVICAAGYAGGTIFIGGIFFLLFFFSAGRWLGFGDVKFAVLMGLLLGLFSGFLAIFLASLLGSIYGIWQIIASKKNIRSQIPFGPFLVSGTLAMLLFGQGISSWYLHFFQ